LFINYLTLAKPPILVAWKSGQDKKIGKNCTKGLFFCSVPVYLQRFIRKGSHSDFFQR
jgi:hypothetical protein